MLPRNAQGLTLPLGRQAGAPYNLAGTLQQAALLQDPILMSTNPGQVTQFRVAGQSIMCSDQSAPLIMLAPDCQVEGHRGMGIPLTAQQEVTIATDLAAGVLSGGINLRPIDPSQVVPINELGTLLDYLFGFGVVNAGIGADFILTARALRPGMLGLMVLAADANPEDIAISSITINNIELQAGEAGAETTVDQYGPFCTDDDGCVLGYPVRQNDQVIIAGHNYNAAAINVRGGCFMLPPGAFAK
jgi:hypothetical protein